MKPPHGAVSADKSFTSVAMLTMHRLHTFATATVTGVSTTSAVTTRAASSPLPMSRQPSYRN